MGLHWGAPVLKSLIPSDLWDKVQSVQTDPHVPPAEQCTLSMLNGATGEPLTSFTFNHFYRLRRSALRTLLSTSLDICYSKKLVSITYPTDGTAVTAHFADTSTATGTLPVGTDGARSTTRSLLLGPKPGTTDAVPFGSAWVHASSTRNQVLFLHSFHPLYLDAARPLRFLWDAARAGDPGLLLRLVAVRRRRCGGRVDEGAATCAS